ASRARGRFTRNFVVQASAADWALVMLVSLRAALANTGLANTGLADTGLADTGLANTGLADTGLANTALASTAEATHRPEVVFFQHDEVIVHCPAEQADEVVDAVARAASAAARLVFGDTRVAFPLSTRVVDCYADAK